MVLFLSTGKAKLDDDTFDAYISIIDETGHRSTRWPKTIRNYTASQSTAFAYERLDLFVYHDGSMSFLASPTSILPISSSSLLHDSFSFVLFFPSRIVGVILSGRNLGKNSCGSHRHVRNSILERIAPSNFTVLHVVLPIDCRHEKVRLQRPHPQGGEPTR